MARAAVIIVTHNAEPYLNRCLRGVHDQGGDPSLIVVDSGSSSTGYLDDLEATARVRFVRTGNIGFARANNLGYELCPADAEYVVFLNPDVFLGADVFARAIEIMEAHPQVGCLTGQLLGYDIRTNRPTGFIDSTGIFRTWYGRWFDRGQGEVDRGQYAKAETVPAACGAFLFCRREALDLVALSSCQIFDAGFFLYKEDIELCLRLRAGDWTILYHPALVAYHCRGWNRTRRAMPVQLRRTAARAEVLLYRRHPSPYMLWALGKYLLVRWLNL